MDEKLRNDTKMLLKSLINTQRTTREAMSMLAKDDNIDETSLNKNLRTKIDEIRFKELINKSNSNSKSVSFSDYLLGSPRRRARSASPKFSSTGKQSRKKSSEPTKSILKKQLDLEDSLQTKSRDKLIKCLSNTRQKYLNHVYDESFADSESDHVSKMLKEKLNFIRKVEDEEKHWSYLFDDGNDRSNSLIRSRSDEKLSTTKVNEKQANKSKKVRNKSPNKFLKNKPLLGYDWISGK
jgi:hypothetical protein